MSTTPTTTTNPVRIERHLRGLCRLRLIRPHDVVVGLTLLWSCGRREGRGTQVSYTRLAEVAGVGRRRTVETVKRLVALGVLGYERTRLRVAWGGGIASRQGRNIYWWLPGLRTEFPKGPADRRQVRKKEGIEACFERPAGPQPPIRTVAEQLRLLLGG